MSALHPNFFKRSVLFFLLSILTFPIAAQQLSQEITDQIDQLLKKQVNGIVPGLAVGIVQNGKVVYQHNEGFANLEHQVAIDKNTRFNIASNAKQFTAYCILKLVEEGKISLEDDMRDYLSQLYPNIKDKITIAQLITHTSGIRDAYDLMGLEGKPWWKRVGLKNKHVIELLAAQQELNFKPGTDFLYSNSNYILLTEIIKKVSGMSFKEYSANVFEELGMMQTGFSTNYMSVIPNKALPYSNWGKAWKWWPMLTNLHGDGFLYTTLTDQLKWEQILQNNDETDVTSLLIKSQRLLPNTSTTTYGAGIKFENYKKLDVITHEGATGSYGAYFMRFPSQKTSIVVLSNSGSVWTIGIAQQVADLILEVDNEQDYFPNSKLDTKELLQAEVLGDYLLQPDNLLITITEKDGSLYREIYQREPVKLIHEAGNIYHYEGNEALKLIFSKNQDGKYNFTLYHPQVAPRIASQLPEDNKMSTVSPAGSFHNDELDLRIDVGQKSGPQYVIKFDDQQLDAQLLRQDHLQADAYTLHLIRNEKGEVTDLLLDYARLRNVRFSKAKK